MRDGDWRKRLPTRANLADHAWIAGSLVAAFVLATLLEPLWFVRVFTEAIPWAIGSLLAVTGLQASTALGIWVGAFVPASVFLGVHVHRWLADHGGDHPEIRDRIHVRVIVTAAFTLGFFLARGFVWLGSLPTPDGSTLDTYIPVNEIWVQGHHIHHFFFGFALVAIAGWMALVHHEEEGRWTAGLYGAGLGVFIDEIGLLLTWGDYWARSSWFVLAAVLTLLWVATLWSWIKATADLEELTRAEGPAIEAEA
jgi:hypothetical protein